MVISNSPYKAYARATHTVSKIRQVVMLCEGAIRFMQQAMEAIRDEDAQARYDKLSKTSEIILALKAALDVSGGDPIAVQLDHFYHQLDSRILAVHHTHDLGECADILKELRNLKDSWDTISVTQ